MATIAAAAAAAGSSVSFALVEPGSNPSHIGTPIRITAAMFTALVTTKMSTERRAIDLAGKPWLCSTHTPSARPPRPLAEMTELTASSDSESRCATRRRKVSKTSAKRIT